MGGGWELGGVEMVRHGGRRVEEVTVVVVLGWEARRVCACEDGGECVSWSPLLTTNTPTPEHCPDSPCLVHPAWLGR